MADYNIRLGVTVDTSNIQSQINKIKNPKVTVDARLNVGSIQRQINRDVRANPILIDARLNTSNIQTQINSIRQQLQQLGNININLGGNTGVGKVAGDVKQASNELKKIQLLARNIGKLDFKIGTLDTKSNANQIKELERQLKLLKIQYNETANSLNKSGIGNIGSVTAQEFVNARNKLAEFEAKIADVKAKLANSIQLKLNNGTFDNDVSNITSKFDKLANKSGIVRKAMNEVSAALSSMRTAATSGDIEGLIAANERYERSLKVVNNQLKINARAERDAAAQQKLANDRSAFQSKIDTWLTKNSAATKKFGAAMLSLRAQAESCDRVTLGNLHAEFSRLDAEAGRAGLKMQSFGDRIKTQFQKYSQYFSVASVIMWTTRGLRDMF